MQTLATTLCITAITVVGFAYAPKVHAQELVPDTIITMKARVMDILSQETRQVPGTTAQGTYQKIRVEVLDGPEKGKIITVENDYLNLKKGETFYLTHTTNPLDGTDHYAVSEPYRLPALGMLALLFVAVVLFFGGRQGARGLLSLVGSLLFITYLLLPGILHGYPPVFVAVAVSSVIICLGSYVTHGFNWTTSTAVIGMICTVALTGLLASVAIPLARLSGMNTEEAVYLSLNSLGTLDLTGLLLGGMIIGILGVLYDAAIGQAIAVEELSAAGPHLSRFEIYRRAVRIGREHVGALVNTLAIAYVGASLPLLLLFYGYGSDSILMAMNRDMFATEIVRTLVGSIGLVLAVPITTAIATRLLVGTRLAPKRDGHGHHHH